MIKINHKRTNQQGFMIIALLVALVVLIGAGTFYVITRQPSSPSINPNPSPAPTPSPSTTIVRKVGERESSFLIQKINENSVEGVWYQQYPVRDGVGTPRVLRIGDDIGDGCEGVSVKLSSIDFAGQTVTFSKVTGQTTKAECPICLAFNTMIDTPAGNMPVHAMKVGDPVWTTDASGRRVAGVVQRISKVAVPPAHKVVHLVLEDRREVFVSPGHPTSDGRTVQDLVPGEPYDGARIVSSDRVAYGEAATYDILPSGATGYYWANGILLDTTLHK